MSECCDKARRRIYFDGDGSTRVTAASDVSLEVSETRPNILVIAPNQPPSPIGTRHPEDRGKTSDEFPGCVELWFVKAESVDVVIEELEKIRKTLRAPQPPDVEEAG